MVMPLLSPGALATLAVAGRVLLPAEVTLAYQTTSMAAPHLFHGGRAMLEVAGQALPMPKDTDGLAGLPDDLYGW